ncbi:MAG TPA: trypsin-like peptidase domain-containing protein [Gemmatales bacterium]|nr:trypsin-like peptidase domain-containing protein [Gemmatales bacterium]
MKYLLSLLLLSSMVGSAWADVSFAEVAKEVNRKMVKVYGAGGYRGVNAYCTGVMISPDGYILTVYSPTLDTSNLRVHLYDGTRHAVELVAAEPQLDVALLRIKNQEPFKEQPLPYFDLTKPIASGQVGDWVLAFTNQFEVAVRDESVSVQRGVIAAIVPFAGRRGITEANYKGMAYIVDAITNNPGANGGLLTTRRGEPLGLIGKELKNTLTETWVNYAMPLPPLADFAAKAMKGQYKRQVRDDDKAIDDKKAYHGIVLISDVLDRTPPYIDDLAPGSPAIQAGLKINDLLIFIRHPRTDVPEEMDEKVISSVKTFKDVVAPLAPGTKINIVVRREGQLLTFDLTLGKPIVPVTPPNKK